MARTIAQIQQQIIDAKEEEADLSGLNSTSKVAVWRLWTYVVAVCIWTLENFFDVHKAEVNATIAKQKPHTLQWYVEMAKKFEYGHELPDDSDVYIPVDESSIVRIVTHASATEEPNMVRMKVAKGPAGALGPLDNTLISPQLRAFKEYMHRIKDAGVRLDISSREADGLKLNLTVYYDPLVLNGVGQRLDNPSVKPLVLAIDDYLKNLPFNGLFIVNRLIDAMENADGVRIAMVDGLVISTADEPAGTGVDTSIKYTPLSGYMNFLESTSTITYIPFES